MVRQCDFHLFLDRCQKPGIYGQPDFPVSQDYPGIDTLIRGARWCEEHKSENDVLLED